MLLSRSVQTWADWLKTSLAAQCLCRLELRDSGRIAAAYTSAPLGRLSLARALPLSQCLVSRSNGNKSRNDRLLEQVNLANVSTVIRRPPPKKAKCIHAKMPASFYGLMHRLNWPHRSIRWKHTHPPSLSALMKTEDKSSDPSIQVYVCLCVCVCVFFVCSSLDRQRNKPQ